MSGCEAPQDAEGWDPPSDTSGGEGDDDALPTTSGGSGGSGDAETGDGSSGAMQPACPEPPIGAQLEPESSTWWCPDGFVVDAAYPLCVDALDALGPFTAAMIEGCASCGGVECDAEVWPADQARGLRGDERCPPGTSLASNGLCVDDEFAWGPFSPAMVEACDAAGGGMACTRMRWDRAFAEALVGDGDDEPEPPVRPDAPWDYILDTDHALREDGLGGGHFGAPRSGNPGGHSGIDFLAPVGEPLRAPCDGSVLAGVAGGYGNFVQLVCRAPKTLGGDLWVSMLYGHLDTLSVANGEAVSRGQIVGTVGKTGNAASAGINAHVHFEMAIHGSESAAFSETHASSNHGGNAAADAFEVALTEQCWSDASFEPLTGPAMKGRRPDPFMVLACLSAKPSTTAPPPSLQSGLVPWSDHYAAAIDLD
ncbi:MAG: M23 family metallopeptidase [Myxococcota bacterium]